MRRLQIGKGIQAKILFLVVGMALVSIATLAFISVFSAQNALVHQAMKQLLAIQGMQKDRIEYYMRVNYQNILAFARASVVPNAMRDLSQSMSRFTLENGLNAENIASLKASLRRYYEDDFAANYKEHTGKEPTSLLQRFESLDANTIAVQEYYLTRKTDDTAQQFAAVNADSSALYSTYHDIYDPIFQKYAKHFQFYDVLLIDSETGTLAYSISKEIDFGTSLINGPYAQSNLGEVFRLVNESDNPQAIKIVDFAPYFPSYEEATSFIAAPIIDVEEGKKIGVLVFHLSTKEINKIMTNNNEWNSIGLGESGETYLVGGDYTMRSISRFLIDSPEEYLNQIETLGVVEQKTLDEIRITNTSVLLQPVRTKGTERALAGESGQEIFPDYRGVPVLSAYTPLKIQGLNWAILSEMDEAEVNNAKLGDEALSLNNLIIFSSMVILMFSILVASLFAKRIRKHLGHIETVVEEVSDSFEELSESAKMQSSAIEQSNSSLEELIASIQDIAGHANNVAYSASTSEEQAKAGGEAVQHSVKAMELINDSSEQITAIIGVISDIAEQINLLALNAAIEAARAGEHGKGFAVVADEVRKLAERSASATQEIAQLIRESESRVQQGAELSDKAGKVLNEIIEHVGKTAEMVEQISVTTEEQAATSNTIKEEMSRLSNIVADNTDSVETLSASAHNLMHQIQIVIEGAIRNKTSAKPASPKKNGGELPAIPAPSPVTAKPAAPTPPKEKSNEEDNKYLDW